jgi:hypothetical protein
LTRSFAEFFEFFRGTFGAEVAVVEVWFVDLNQVIAVDLGKILLEHDLQPPQVATS